MVSFLFSHVMASKPNRRPRVNGSLTWYQGDIPQDYMASSKGINADSWLVHWGSISGATIFFRAWV